jgi:uncharacterized membrane protein YdbT with pleckstrin-like domain
MTILIFCYMFGLLFSSGAGECLVNGQVADPSNCSSFGDKLIGFGWFISVVIVIGSFLSTFVTQYAITSKRVILKTGYIGADIRSVYFDQIKSTFVDVGLPGRVFGTGNLNLDLGQLGGGQYNARVAATRLANISNPYEVYKLVQGTLSNHKESMHSGRLDYTENREEYKDFVQETEKMRRDA